jgi:secreted Zn-dependent insulinase-like peptidase
MLRYPALQVDERAMLFFAPDDVLYDKYLKTLTPENVTVITQFPEAKTDAVEPVYGTEYSVAPISEETKKSWSEAQAKPVAGYKYPAANIWIPTSFQLHKTETSEFPRVLTEDARGKIWFKQETGPDTKPIGFASIRIWTPELGKSPRNFLLARIHEKAFDVTQTERLAPLADAGYGAGLTVSASYVQLSVQGYSEKFADVLYDLLASPTAGLNSIKISDDELTKIKGDLKKEFADYKVKAAISRAVAKKHYLVASPTFEIEQYEGLLDSVTTNEVNSFTRDLYKRIYVDAFVYGNLLGDPLKDLASRTLASLKAEALSIEERNALEQTETVIAPSRKLVSAFQGADNNNGMIVQIDTGLRTYTNDAVNSMLGNLIKDRFYNDMRTNQQLGYIVQGGSSTSKVATRLDFYIQSSDYQPEELSKRTLTFLSTLLSEIESVLTEKFEETKAGLILELSRKPTVMAERYAQFLGLWMGADADWTYNQSLVQELQKLTPEEVKAHAVKALTPESHARLSIYYFGTKSTLPENFGEDVSVTSKSEFERLAN